MKFDIHANIHLHDHRAAADDVAYILNDLRGKVANLKESLMAILDPLTAEVAESKTIMESAVVLIEGIAAKLEAAKNDPVEIQRLADELNASSEPLAAAVAANTSAE